MCWTLTLAFMCINMLKDTNDLLLYISNVLAIVQHLLVGVNITKN